MIFQLVVFLVVGLAVLGTATPQSADDHGLEHHHEDHHKDHHEEHHEEHYHEPNYKFEYEVKDEHTGDYKHHRESRKGDDVEGYYSLLQPDGTTREVHYTSAKHVGFNAVVTNSGKPIETHHEEKHEEPKVHHHVLEHHEEIKHHEPKHHHHHHEEIFHHEPKLHHQEHHENEHKHKIEEHHEPKHYEHEPKHYEHEPKHYEHDFSGFSGDYGSSNSPVPSKLKYQGKYRPKHHRSIRPYSVYENAKERRGYSLY